jgi:hypothetical protein
MNFNKLPTLLFSVLSIGLFFVTSSLPVPLEAADLHAILVGDTTDSELGYAFQKDLDLMHREVKKIADETGLSLNFSLFHGRQVTP